jgi:excisionase family DNA binding protein
VSSADKAYLTVKELAAELSIGQDAAYELVRQIGFRVGDLWRVRREVLNAWVENQEKEERTKWRSKRIGRACTSAAGAWALAEAAHRLGILPREAA